jgi:hypothetical protein
MWKMSRKGRSFKYYLSAGPSGSQSLPPLGQPHVARRPPLRARGDGGVPSTRPPAAAAHRTAWRG